MGMMKIDKVDDDVKASTEDSETRTKIEAEEKARLKAERRKFLEENQGFIPLGIEMTDGGPRYWIWSNYHQDAVSMSATMLDKEVHYYSNFGPEYCDEILVERVCVVKESKNKDAEYADQFVLSCARDKVITECHSKGRYSLDSMLRGAGVWSDGEGGLIVNGGPEIHRIDKDGNVSQVKRLYGRHMYPLTSHGIWTDVEASYDEVKMLIEAIDTWRWRNHVDYAIFGGWLLSQPFVGAAPVRPGVSLTGKSMSGKSTLMSLAKSFCEGWSFQVLAGKSTTVAGVQQELNQDAMTVFIDETQPTEGTSPDETARINRVLTDIRQHLKSAYSNHTGTRIYGDLKGSTSGKSISRSLVAACMYASTVRLDDDEADANRVLNLNLREFPRVGNGPPILPDDLGPRVYRRMWSRYSQFCEYFKLVVDRIDHNDIRVRQTFGAPIAALAAGLDLSLDDQYIAGIIKAVNECYCNPEVETSVAHVVALAKLLASPLELDRGVKIQVGDALVEAIKTGLGQKGRGSGGAIGTALRMSGITAKLSSTGQIWMFVASTKHGGVRALGARLGIAGLTSVLSESPAAKPSTVRVRLGAGSLWAGVWIPTEIVMKQVKAGGVQEAEAEAEDDIVEEDPPF
ncbi:hypothetical protein [Acidiphilium acidophilum]|uniref:DUF927 domain-containing protein n=1 Tax=Acidiphilium acidophilum TaxID=76588 RepID=A0AAW9DTT2_ACIAO|nr:hypothetical protein [Acidiphilium acidophilum]MDX5931758.1 hypothetical protein [Acidiphilium acidophilum]